MLSTLKKLFVTVCVSFLIGQLVKGQAIDLSKTKSTLDLRDSYIKKYKTNKTTGWVLLGSGIGMIVGGGIIVASYAGQGFNGAAPVTEEALLLIVGPSAALASIPFFIAAKRNKTKATLLIKGESVTIGNKAHYKSNYAAVALTIPLF